MVLPQLVYSLSEQNRFYKKAAYLVLESGCKTPIQLAQAVVDSGIGIIGRVFGRVRSIC